MARVENVKMAALAAMILLAAALSGRGPDRVVQVDPMLVPAPPIETQLLTG